jgi:hypothetical protein
MARIFLSHSSGNNAEAVALRDWLVSHGWDDLFLDLDPGRGLKAGERWQADDGDHQLMSASGTFRTSHSH